MNGEGKARRAHFNVIGNAQPANEFRKSFLRVTVIYSSQKLTIADIRTLPSSDLQPEASCQPSHHPYSRVGK